MSTGIDIREARPDDANGIARVHIKSWQETYRGIMPDDYIDNLESNEGERRRSSWTKILSDPANRRTNWVALRDGEIVGFVSIGRNRDKELLADGEIYVLYLLKAHQGRGIGRSLFEKGMSLLKEMGMKSASLWVAKGNATEGFYRHLGGTLQGEKIDTCGGVDALAECRYVWPDLALKAELSLRELKNETESLRRLQQLLEATPTYHQRVNGVPAAPDEAQRLFLNFPIGKGASDKTILGIYLNGNFIGCADLVQGYPNSHTCFLGLLLIREDLQRKGYGITAYRAVENLIRERSTYSIVRLATVASNADVNWFWKKMGFHETGERKPYQHESVISEYILFENRLS